MSDSNSAQRFIYAFGDGRAEGGEEIRHLIGGKGASLAEMTKARLNVPPGFTISAACCDLYYKAERRWPAGLEEQVRAALARLEQLAGRTFGRGGDPLLVAVRSGAAQSMPGMMDTILNVGLNPECVHAMGERTGNRRGAWEAYRHFLVMFGHTVGKVEDSVFTELIAEMLRETGKPTEQDLDAAQMEALCGRFRDAYHSYANRELPTDPWELIRQAIDAVFASWNNERAIAYRQHHHVEGLLGTAVNVQMMCPSEVSGVMFTANPVNPALEQIVIESSYGLGEAVVLGKVTPDRFVLDKRSLKIAERTISDKRHVIATLAQDGQGQTGARDVASLSDPQVEDLGRLGLRVEEYFKKPCDIEWALSGGKFYLLQARGIKGLDRAAVEQAAAEAAERERVRREEISALAARVQPGGTVWARYNLAEILPQPTPMSWAIVRRFMSGRGGFGQMYRDLGFIPHPSLDEEGIYDLVCGRPYCNLSREPLMQFSDLPLGYPFAALKADPGKAIYPQQMGLDPARAGWRFWLSVPVVIPAFIVRSTRRQLRLATLSATFADELRQQLIPAFVAETGKAAAEDLTSLGTPALLERLDHWRRRTLDDFARDSLKPTVLTAVAMDAVRRLLEPALGADRAGAAVGELTMGIRPDADADVASAVQELAAGRLDRAAFLEKFGHRGADEMELAHPRWSEDPAALDQLAAGRGGDHAAAADPQAVRQRIETEAKLQPAQRTALEGELRKLQTFMGLRETAKHYLLRGYALVRRILVELDRRHRLDGGIFYLIPDELPRLAKGEDLSGVIAGRRRRREVALSLEAPQVIFSDDLEALGRPITVAGADTLRGVPLSAGMAEAPALVLREPTASPPAEPYILVCPTTDPAWVPLFVQAKGLVMETGGVLSHGAIVAREFGLPAVAGLPDVHRRLRTGQRLRVDGGTGTVTVMPA
jgi:pyruvate,water dikinase